MCNNWPYLNIYATRLLCRSWIKRTTSEIFILALILTSCRKISRSSGNGSRNELSAYASFFIEDHNIWNNRWCDVWDAGFALFAHNSNEGEAEVNPCKAFLAVRSSKIIFFGVSRQTNAIMTKHDYHDFSNLLISVSSLTKVWIELLWSLCWIIRRLISTVFLQL